MPELLRTRVESLSVGDTIALHNARRRNPRLARITRIMELDTGLVYVWTTLSPQPIALPKMTTVDVPAV